MNNICSVVVLNAQIPVSFHVINEYNNELKILRSGILTTTITIKTGKYNANTLITELKTQFSSADMLFSNIKINKNSGKLVFTSYVISNYSFSGSVLDIIGTTTSVNSSSTTYQCIYQRLFRYAR